MTQLFKHNYFLPHAFDVSVLTLSADFDFIDLYSDDLLSGDFKALIDSAESTLAKFVFFLPQVLSLELIKAREAVPHKLFLIFL
jgi:hypothetical protein